MGTARRPVARRFAPRRCAALAALAAFVSVPPAIAQPDGDPGDDLDHSFGIEAKAHFRDTDEARFPVPFPFAPIQLPVGDTRGFIEAVDPGSHAEVSTVSLWYRGAWDLGGVDDGMAAKVKVDLIDRYDRNPTSEDDEFDVDEAWIRFGTEVEPGDTHEGWSGYVKVGKMPKFERQDDRHLESYGLVSTAFNRMEDVGVEVGFDLGRHFYMKASYTDGNPLFFRDPNALAGDNGISIFDGSVPNPDPELKTGIPILYDADIAVQDVTFDEPEVGLGLGVRFGSDDGNTALDVLAWGYERDLKDTVEFEGTFYGGDLDLLLGPLNLFPPPAISGVEKSEWGLNIWLYHGGFSFFGQYVDQEVANLPRTGYEVEVAWDFELPWRWTAFGRQLFPWIAPAVRFSRIEPEFAVNRLFPAPSIRWEWDKVDVGVRLGLVEGLDLTAEYAANDFVRAGRTESADEMLVTLRWEWQRDF